ncbi:chemotaxis protein CheW [Maridesulfovibrio frigidus]|uniref:chemotaxis protein CheW n=1 Tax=Maridesulfovibrio frigidus TaxID=340956 RepID=UPI0004E14F49|nr:chemotaxis protein CheW [Maridesulfovibrio frigidus]
MATRTNDTNQFLTYILGKEIFALDISTVREVLELTNITSIPRTPNFMKGVINLRGRAVPVMGLRSKLGMGEIKHTVNTCIIIVEVNLEDEFIVIGVLVDSVREVIEMTPESIEPPPRMGTSVHTDFITGMGRQNDEFIMILNIDGIFSAEELAGAVQQSEGQAADIEIVDEAV